MNSKKGLSIMSVTIIIIVIIIISSTVVIAGSGITSKTKLKRFATEILQVEEAVNQYVKRKSGVIDWEKVTIDETLLTDEEKTQYVEENISKLFKENGGEFYIVELETDINERVLRNKTENRLQHKPTKRNIEWSEQELLNSVTKYRLNSEEYEIKQENYFRINNTNLSAEDVAKIIKDKFEL